MKITNLFLFIFLLNVKFSQSQTPCQDFKYTFAHPIGLVFNKYSTDLTNKDSCVIEKFSIFIIDSTNFLNNGCFFIQVESIKEELDSNNLINFHRATNIKKYLSQCLLKKEPNSKYNLRIFNSVFNDDKVSQPSKSGLIFASINLLFLQGYKFDNQKGYDIKN
jgi:hypothetical protein